MATFKYEAQTKSGAAVQGVIEASSESDAVIQLKQSYTLILSLKEIVEKEDIFEKYQASKKIDQKALSLVCKQFSIILTAGMPITNTVELVANQTEDKNLKKILTKVATEVAAGHGLANAFALHGPTLPTTFIETVRAGEESGVLDESFERLAKFFEARSKTRGKVVSALLYPAMVVVVAIIVIAIIMIVAVPAFTTTYEDYNMELPGVTKALIAMSDFFANAWPFMLGAILIVVIAFLAYRRTETGLMNTSRWALKIPILGRIMLMNGTSQFANSFATMLSSGLPITKAISVAGRTLSNYAMATAIQAAGEGVEAGYRIGDCLGQVEYLPALLVEMAAVGEESGSLERTLGVVGEYYDNEVEVASERALNLLEPIIICVLAVFAVFILFAAYLPMFSMYEGVA